MQMKEIMKDFNTFDWDVLDGLFEGAAARHKHVALSFFIHWPSSLESSVSLPDFLVDRVDMLPTDNGDSSPDYQNPDLLVAMEQCIRAVGRRYDGDRRLLTVHISLVGFWWVPANTCYSSSIFSLLSSCTHRTRFMTPTLFLSLSFVPRRGEFHTYPYEYLAESTKQSVVDWFRQSFTKTRLQARYPRDDTKGVGYYDASFCYSTLDGPDNGGESVSWYFWPKIEASHEVMAWQTAFMGGEIRPELQSSIFTPDYAAGTLMHQDFYRCAATTHMTFLVHHHAFCHVLNDVELALTRRAHAFLGYQFVVSQIIVTPINDLWLSVSVTVVQTGIAPFYYDLALQLQCRHDDDDNDDTFWRSAVSAGVENLIHRGDTADFCFNNVPVATVVDREVEVRLVSSYTYDARPIRFAQGDDGIVSFVVAREDLVVCNE
jgi:hypothetical protein